MALRDDYLDSDLEDRRRRVQPTSTTYTTTPSQPYDTGPYGSGQRPGQPPTTPQPAPAPKPAPAPEITRANVLNTLKRYGAPTTENLKKAIAANPWLGTLVSGDKLRLSNGETWDVIKDVGGPAAEWITLTGHTAAAKAAAAAKAGASGTISGSSSSTPQTGPFSISGSGVTTNVTPNSISATQAADPQTDAIRDQLFNQLMARANQSLDVDPNDPIIRNQVDAYSAQAERARRNYLADVAEKSSPYSTGAQRNEERMTAEKLGQNVGGFQAELMARELASRRAEVSSALDSLGSRLTETQRQSLQTELAQLDAAIDRQRLADQNSQFFAQLGQQGSQFADTLAQRNREFDVNTDLQLKQLGLTAADRDAYWNAVYQGLL